MKLLEQYRTKKGFSKAALAEILGISPSMMSLLLSGQRFPSVTLTKRIESITGIPRARLRPDIFGDAA